jgi:hypothetical protein
MCTLIVLDRVVPGLPIIVASNRDEYLSRPAAPPARMNPLGDRGVPFVAPQDLEAGGTWMGVNANGLFAGLTNRPTESKRADLRSRGLLMIEALERGSADEVAEFMSGAVEGRYNPFNLLCADGRSTWVTRCGENQTRTERLEPGVHVLCNRDVDDGGSPKISAIRERLAPFDPAAPLPETLDLLSGMLRSHAGSASPFESVCVHTPGYGTRSSALIALGERRWRWWHADGPPCDAKYRNHTTLLDELRQSPDASR